MLAGGVGRPPVCGTNRHPWLVIPPGSAGVPPASLFLQTASHPRPLPCKARQARLDGVLLHRARSCAARRPPGARASRPHPYSCKQPPIQGYSPARRAKPAFNGFSSIVPGLVRARRPPGARASRPHPYSCKQPPMHGHSPARRAKPAFKGFSSIVPGLCAGETPAFPGGLVRARRPRSRGIFTPSPFPILGGPL